MSQTTTAAVIVAAGRGQRAGGGVPKQYRLLDGEPVLRRTLWAFCGHPDIGSVCVVIHPDDKGLFDKAVEGLPVTYCFGGDTRSQSVRNGLDKLMPAMPKRVLIHDAARPFVTQDLIARLIDALDAAPAAIPYIRQTDATFVRDGNRIDHSVDRNTLVRAQTPQAFDFDALRKAFETAVNTSYPDEASLARAAGLEVALIEGDPDNIKLTYARDFGQGPRVPAFRFATGYDVHRLGAGDGVWLGGVLIPCPYRLIGHSDADVALHALTDAILGTVGAGDIGQHFPPSDDRWKGASSDAFLRHAVNLAGEARARIVHADLTLICEVPRIGPHRAAMKMRIAEILEISEAAVNIKATTTEGLGFTGRREGIAAQASVTVQIDE
ncbi:bifunctional 2-C-methyl-D-erythritol 4-phosphate cytidylyltransferase/2-C-methyl-D-erythritol 2,4-cyclodiphosphate synthase [Hyphobacterium sp.]|uniref:bifunctional 2-C-methyl-D-erythritol 4-phosphate cytidylyltransferase/2-C-methyl-D-erythritol 2,4-cyclodiphosphate synthase n=1 Tax=Hyphobacterium sp. TaxID=2004662 RepID=UPI003BAB30E1